MKHQIGRERATSIAYGNLCTLSYCEMKRKAGHRYCDHHKYILLYRGAPEQNLIPTKTQNFARKTVELLITENQGNPKWNDLMAAIEERWISGQAYVTSELSKYYKDGIAMSSTTRKGLIICNDIFTTLGLEKAFVIWCSWQYLQDWNPRLFATDESFKHQVIKNLRNRAKSYHTQDINKLTGKQHAYSSVLYMNEREVVWSVFIKIFGSVGMQLHKQLERRAEKLRSNTERIRNAIKHIE